MDNRLKFLYCNVSEMWGHRQRAGAGNGETGASEVGEQQANPAVQSKGVTRSEIKVAKPVSWLSGKAAIVYIVPVP